MSVIYSNGIYEKLSLLGQGAYGKVFKVKHRTTGLISAMKELENTEDGIEQTTLREISALQELQGHPNIVTLQNIIMDIPKTLLILDYLPTDLEQFLGSIPSGKHLDPYLVKKFLFQLADGTNFCHSRRILHRDLKPSNLLVDPDRAIIKIADFGIARLFHVPVRTYSPEVVTLWYRAPELLLTSDRYSTGVDIWSIGVILTALCNKQPLFRGDSDIGQLIEIFKILGTPTEDVWQGVSNLPNFNSSFPIYQRHLRDKNLVKNLNELGLALLEKLLAYDPVKRINAITILDDPFFK
jgi:cyclin-dependent kinase 1